MSTITANGTAASAATAATAATTEPAPAGDYRKKPHGLAAMDAAINSGLPVIQRTEFWQRYAQIQAQHHGGGRNG